MSVHARPAAPPTTGRRWRRLLLAVSLTGALVAGGCGDDEEDLPEPTGDPEGDEVVPGEEGPVD